MTITTTHPHPDKPEKGEKADLSQEQRAARIDALKVELAALEAEHAKGAFVEYPKVVDGVTYPSAAAEKAATDPAPDPPKKKS